MESPHCRLLTVACADLDNRGGRNRGRARNAMKCARNERGIKSGSVPNDGLQVSWGSSFSTTLQEINPSIIKGKEDRLVCSLYSADVALSVPNLMLDGDGLQG